MEFLNDAELNLTRKSVYETLSDAELCDLARSGNDDAFNLLTFRYYKMLKKRVFEYNRFRNSFLSEDDLFQLALIGFYNAVMNFDVSKGAFPSYVDIRVKGTIYRETWKTIGSVAIPEYKWSKYLPVSRELSHVVSQGYSVNEACELVSQKLNISIDEVKEALQLSNYLKKVSINMEIDEDGNELGDTIGVWDREHECEIEANSEIMNDILATLRPRDREIIILLFGLNGEEPMTLEEIARYLGVSKVRVHQIKERALKSLRNRDIEEQFELLWAS